MVARAEFGSQSSPGHNTHPSKAHTHRRLTLTPARTYKVAPQFVVRQPFLYILIFLLEEKSVTVKSSKKNYISERLPIIIFSPFF